jgi:hypothetical protein
MTAMRTQPCTLEPPASDVRVDVTDPGAEAIVIDAALARRVRGEYAEMPGMRLTIPQAARLFGLTAEIAEAVLDDLRRASFLGRANDGRYALVSDVDGEGPPDVQR